MGMIFSAYDIRGKGSDPEAMEFIWNVGKAYAEWLQFDGAVFVSKTPNADENVVRAFMEGIMLQGRNVIDGGQADKATIINAISEKKAAGGVIIDHNDLQAVDIISLFDSNGVNVTSDNGLEQINEQVLSGNFLPAPTKGELVAYK